MIDVQFELNRLVFRREHLAMRNPYRQRQVLFPDDTNILEQGLAVPSAQALAIVDMTTFDKRVAANPPQLQAVTAIARLPAGGIPFIIFGP